MPTTVTNEYLRKEFNDFEMNDDLGNLLEELKYSTLIVPIDDERGGCPMIEIAGRPYLPLFTDIHEFQKVNFDGRFRLKVFDFNFYLELLKDGLHGFVVNVESERFPITEAFLKVMDTDYMFDLDYQPFTAREIRNVYDSIDNAQLKDFLDDESNRWNLDGLMEVLLNSDLLTLAVSRKNLEGHQEDGVISLHDAERPRYLRTEDNYALLYSSADRISMVPDGYYAYSSLVNLGLFIDFSLKDGIAGIMLDDDIVISRDFLIDFMKGFRCPCIDKYDDYVFVLGD